MNPNEYQEQLNQYVVYPQEHWREYLPMALFGEMGEVANVIKKSIRNGQDYREMMIDEFGDVMFYLARLATESGLEFQSFFYWAELDSIAPAKARHEIREFFRQLWTLDILLEKSNHPDTVRLYGGPLLYPVLRLMKIYAISQDEVFEANLLKVSRRASENNLKHT